VREPLKSFIVLAALAAPLLAQAQSFAPTQSDFLALQPGDALQITVWHRPELSGQFTVAADGSVTHPLYRSIKIAGMPLPAVEERVLEFLRRFDAQPEFVVEPLLRVAVAGDVMRPNLYMLSPTTTVAQAVAVAGGPTERGRRDRVLVVRGNTVVVVDLTRPAAAATRIPIHSGDQITVERRRSLFRDFIAPTLTLSGATAAIVNVILRAGR
jgi:polysaccharide export outer membrane protein